MSVSQISTSSLLFIHQMTFEKSIPVRVQNIIHPNNIDKNFHDHSMYVVQVTIPHSSITPNITRKSATAVPSLKRLSHSKRIVSLRGAPIDLKIDSTATGSVAEISIQNNKHTKNGTGNPTTSNRKNNTIAIILADIINQNIAKIPIVFQLRSS